jgi:hypothetical protein
MDNIIQKIYEKKSGYGDYNVDDDLFVNTYGEVTYEGYKNIMKGIKCKNKVFCDLGSGIGKLVVYNGFGKNLKQSIGIELNSNRHKIAQQTLKNIRNNIKGGKRKNIKFINDTLFNKNYFNYDIYFISNLCFNEKMNKKLAKYFKKYNTTKGATVFCSKKLPMRKNVRKVELINCPMTWDSSSTVYKYILN